MKLRILYHGHCFDGVASAATFTRFYKERIHPEAVVNYTGLLHRPGNLFDVGMFDSDENAIVDFKYAASEKLTWWFDHHESAFLTPEDEAHFTPTSLGESFSIRRASRARNSLPTSRTSVSGSMPSRSRLWSTGRTSSMARFTNRRRSASS